MTNKTVAIIGAGNGGITAAADLADRGFDVRLYQNEAFADGLQPMIDKGGVTLEEEGRSTFVPIPVITTDLKEAVDEADVIMLTVPGDAIRPIARDLAPLVQEDQVIFLNGAASLGAVRFVQEARRQGIQTSFNIAETNSLTYGTRAFPEEARVELGLRVKRLYFAAYPKEKTDALYEICYPLYDCLVKADSIWETTLENGNPEVHPGPSLLNAGRIDYSNGEFWLYKEGITEHTVIVLRAIEAERMAIGRAFGYTLEDAVQSRARRGYFESEEGDLQTLFNTSPVFTKIKGPVSVHSRYFTEDIRMGLVLWSDLGRIANVPTPNIDAVITLASTMLKEDFRQTGLTLADIEMNENTVDALKARV